MTSSGSAIHIHVGESMHVDGLSGAKRVRTDESTVPVTTGVRLFDGHAGSSSSAGRAPARAGAQHGSAEHDDRSTGPRNEEIW